MRLARRRVAALVLLAASLVPASAGAAPGWETGPPMPSPRANHTMTLLASGKVLVAGGGNQSPPFANGVLFDPATDTWTVTGSLKVERRDHTATRLNDGRVLVAGGYAGALGVTATAELYKPATGTWSDAAPMTTARMNAAATLLMDGRVLVTGGAAGTPSAEIYDPALDHWTPTQAMGAVRASHTATRRPDGRVLVVGGSDGTNPLASSESYDPGTGSWSSWGNMTNARSELASVALQDGVLVTGGLGPDPAATAQFASPSGWNLAAAMATPRAFHTATVLDNGQVLVAGGTTKTLKLASAELYDRARNGWSPAGSMSDARTSHAAVLLPDGRVLVTGGMSAASPSSSALASTSLWTPATSVDAPAAVAFGSQTIGETGRAVAAITNTGDSKLLVRDLAIGGPQAGEFAVVENGCGTAVLVGGSCSVTLRFSPLGVGPRAAELTFSANSAAGQHAVGLAGTGALAPPASTPDPTVAPTPQTPPATVAKATVTPAPSKRVAIPFKSSFSPPPGYSKARACGGMVTLRLRAATRVIATRTVKLDRRCRYSTTFRVARAAVGGRRVLSVAVRFRGNRYMAPTTATYQVRVPRR